MWIVVTDVQSKSFGLVTQRRHYNEHPIYALLSYVAHIIFFIVECGIMRFLCAMHVFDVRASSSFPRLPLCQISLAASIAELASGEKSCTQSLTHRVYLIPQEPKLSFRNNTMDYQVEKPSEKSHHKMQHMARCLDTMFDIPLLGIVSATRCWVGFVGMKQLPHCSFRGSILQPNNTNQSCLSLLADQHSTNLRRFTTDQYP